MSDDYDNLTPPTQDLLVPLLLEWIQRLLSKENRPPKPSPESIPREYVSITPPTQITRLNQEFASRPQHRTRTAPEPSDREYQPYQVIRGALKDVEEHTWKTKKRSSGSAEKLLSLQKGNKADEQA